ncbi:flagellar hook-length control protein FliK [Providencia rettgeri]|nr:flagellar hook-length control protein FliK [Providencia rettgeri]
MDVNTPNAPAISSSTGLKNSHNQQNDPRLDADQVSVLPFQAVLDNQQSVQKPTNTNDLTANKTSHTAADTVQTENSPQPTTKQQAEYAIDQMNYSRTLRRDGEHPVLQTQLLNQTDSLEQTWLNNLKVTDDSKTFISASTQFADGKQMALIPFAEKSVQLNASFAATVQSEEDSELRAPIRLTDLDNKDQPAHLTAFIKNEKEERKDQPLLPLNESKKIVVKDLSHDFMPLNKKSIERETFSVSQAISNGENTGNLKSAFTSSVDSSLLQPTSTQSASAHTVSMMPTPTATHTVSTNTLMIPMQPGVPLGSEAWQQQINQHMLFFSRQGISQAQIRLHPEDLGSLNVHLRIEDNQAVMHFVSPHSHVRAAMESMMPILRNALQESGIHLAQGSVGQDTPNGQSGSNKQTNHQQSLPSSSATLVGIASSESSLTPSAQPVTRARGGIDTFA